jgi:hypothetical protein
MSLVQYSCEGDGDKPAGAAWGVEPETCICGTLNRRERSLHGRGRRITVADNAESDSIAERGETNGGKRAGFEPATGSRWRIGK